MSGPTRVCVSTILVFFVHADDDAAGLSLSSLLTAPYVSALMRGAQSGGAGFQGGEAAGIVRQV